MYYIATIQIQILFTGSKIVVNIRYTRIDKICVSKQQRSPVLLTLFISKIQSENQIICKGLKFTKKKFIGNAFLI